MLRKEAEEKILNYLMQIEKIINEYYPEDDYLSMCIRRDFISFNNTHWEHPKEGVLDFAMSRGEEE